MVALAITALLRLTWWWLVSAFLASVAHATPPPAGTPDAEELRQFSDEQRRWIAGQHDQAGRWCCDEGDFAFVEVREHDGHMQARAEHPDARRGIPEGWLDVPDDKRVDLSGQKSVPDVVAAWYYNGRVQCLLSGGGY
jgi:hypothetical protein